MYGSTRLVTRYAKQLIVAVSNRSYGEVASIIKQGIDVNVQDNEGCTALHVAASTGFCVSLLLTAHADVEIRDTSGNTPLMLACCSGLCNVIRCLLEAGADPNTSNDHDHTPLSVLLMKGHTSCVDFLLKKGADINSIFVGSRRSSKTFLEVAISRCVQRPYDMFVLVLKNLADVKKLEKCQSLLSSLQNLPKEGIFHIMLILADLGYSKRKLRTKFEASARYLDFDRKWEELLKDTIGQPSSLKQLSRNVIRHQLLDVNICVDSYKLPLPRALQEYAALDYLHIIKE